MKELENCRLCPRECGINRKSGQLGYCGSNADYNIGSICLHLGEEPALSGKKGICNVFFTGCNLQCLYCQNYQISRRKGRLEDVKYSIEQITDTIIGYLDQGIEAVGFVSPTHYAPHVRNILERLHSLGYSPFSVYNTNGYEKPEILRSFEGLIDIYLPDFKYLDPLLAQAYSDACDYPEIIKSSIREMYRQKGSTVVLNDNGQAVTGLIIRHLVLPGQVNDSIEILKWIAMELSPSVTISLMSQYYPTVCITKHPVLNRRLTSAEYLDVQEALEDLGFHRGWIQDYESAELYNPDFTKNKPFDIVSKGML